MCYDEYSITSARHIDTIILLLTEISTLTLGYGKVKNGVTRLVLTPTLTLNDPLSQNFTTKCHGHFKNTNSGNGNVYANYRR